MDDYWANSKDVWFGPYAEKEDAEKACDESGAGRADLGQMASDVKHQTRILGIYNTTESYRLGRDSYNTAPALEQLPGTVRQLGEVEDDYLW
jgi:hypothetical protein